MIDVLIITLTTLAAFFGYTTFYIYGECRREHKRSNELLMELARCQHVNTRLMKLIKENQNCHRCDAGIIDDWQIDHDVYPGD